MIRVFHGSRAILGVGDLILPPRLTGVKNAVDLGYDHHLVDRVYGTRDFNEAASYAITALIEGAKAAERAESKRRFVGPGKVFEIESVGPIGFDMDYDDYPKPEDYVHFERGIIRRVLDIPNWLVRARYDREIAEYGRAELVR